MDDRSGHAHRQLIGWLGAALPILLLIIGARRPTAGLPDGAVLDSVSAYYYTGAVAAFVGILIALAVFFFSYWGYKNDYQRRDRVAAYVAGAAAVLVAVYPTAAPGDVSRLAWWTPNVGKVHHAAAAVLFLAFIFFSVFLFPQTKDGKKARTPDKRRRNAIYYVCGAAMAVCVLWAALAGAAGQSIFWQEAFALWFFAVSWLVKGRVDQTAVASAQRVAHYGRHPVELARDVGAALRTGTPAA